MKNSKILGIAACLLMISGFANAQDSDERKGKGDRKGDRRGPPAEMIDACAASVAGDPCSFETRRGRTRDGECTEARNEVLVCRPEGMDKDGDRRGLRRRHHQEEEAAE